MAIKSPAKLKIIEFLEKCPMNDEYKFIHMGSVEDAHEFVKRMRTELSRLRRLALQKNYKVAKFKVILISIELLENIKPIQCIVTLRKSDNGLKELHEVLDKETIKNLVEAAGDE